MKKIIVFLVGLFWLNIASADDFSFMQRAVQTPDMNAQNIKMLSKYLTAPYDKDYDKLKIIAYWIATHIAYDRYKYNDNGLNKKETQVTYDILKVRTGICSEFAQLFAQMAEAAGVKVMYVTGYVLEGQKQIKTSYRLKDMPDVGHAWNEAEIDGRKFFIDTTFMTGASIGDNRRRASSLRHKLDLNKRKRNKEVNKNINKDFFDFTPKQELKKFQILHVMDKYIKD